MRQKFVKTFVFMFTLASIFSVCTFSNSKAVLKKPRLNITSLSITLNRSFTLRLYNMKKKYKAKYSSSDSSIVSVAKIGKMGKTAKITANGIGTATITVNIKKGNKLVSKKKCTLLVTPSGVSIKFMKKRVIIGISRSTKLKTIIKPSTSTEAPIFESEDPSIAAVTAKGIVHGISTGETRIKATLLSSGLVAYCKIIVTEDDDLSIDKVSTVSKIE